MFAITKRKSPESIESLIHNIRALNKEYIEDWIKNGGNINEEDSDDMVLLYHAVTQGRTELVRVLLECGADVNKADRYGETPFYWAAEQLEIIAILVEQNAKAHQSSWKGRLEIVKLLIEHNVDVNKASKRGCTPLYSAAQRGRLEIVNLLLEHNADVNKASDSGGTPLSAAAWCGHLEIVKLLIEHNADVNRADKVGYTPLYGAAYQGNLEIVKLLLEHNAAVYAKTNEGKTVLDIAIEKGNAGIIQVLKEAMEMPWDHKRHHLYPLEVRQQISTIFKLGIKQTEFSQLPKDILFVISNFIATGHLLDVCTTRILS